MNKFLKRSMALIKMLACSILILTVASCHSETKYAKGYSDKKFASIKIGMSEKQVLDLLGEPLSRWHPYEFTNSKNKRHYLGLQYSESPTSTHYYLRQIYLNRGTVAEVISSYYID